MGQKKAFLMFGGTLLLIVSTVLVSCGFNSNSDTITYGTPRTFQMDAVVGHHDGPGKPSHFVVINTNGLIEVMEFPGGDSAHERTYIGPRLSGTHAGQAPVNLSFIDVTGNGRLDMVIQAQGNQFVLLNDGEKFVPVPASEEKQVMQRLHSLENK